MGMVAAGTALCVSGNHEAKLVRALAGAKVTVSHGLAESLDAAGRASPRSSAAAGADVHGRPDQPLRPRRRPAGGRPRGAARRSYHGRASGRVRSFALYGDTTGETDEYGLPVRYPWAAGLPRRARWSSTATRRCPTAEWVNNTICLDTGVVFGGALTALRYPERELVVGAGRAGWYEPARPLVAGRPAGARAPPVLDLDDVAGTRWLETAHAGTVKSPRRTRRRRSR